MSNGLIAAEVLPVAGRPGRPESGTGPVGGKCSHQAWVGIDVSLCAAGAGSTSLTSSSEWSKVGSRGRKERHLVPATRQSAGQMPYVGFVGFKSACERFPMG